jgi:pimeloyl-ACP methyl ester carboxylesterase
MQSQDMEIAQPDGTKTVVTVSVPDQLDRPPTVFFAFPGATYSRRYFQISHPALEGPGQAEYHVARGSVFVSCDHLGVGDSTGPEDPFVLTLEALADANAVTVSTVVERLRQGELAPHIEPIDPAGLIGVGQSMGGGILTVQQARHRTFDGVAFLGWSGIRTVLAKPGGGFRLDEVPARRADLRGYRAAGPSFEEYHYAFHHDDVPDAIVEADLGWARVSGSSFQSRGGPESPWGSATVPVCAVSLPGPGVVADEAAQIDVPVLVAAGDRDVLEDPRAEPGAYRSSADITLAVFEKMAHMHNFAGTRRALWDRLAHWADGVVARRDAYPGRSVRRAPD